MAVSIKTLGTVTPPEPEAAKTFSESYRHSIIESDLQPETSMLTMVDGIPFRAEVYIPAAAADEEIGPFGPSNVPVYQSYHRINEMILFQEGDAAFSFDPEKAESTQTMGVFFVANNKVPTQYTLFIADIGDGKAGLFQVTEVPTIPNLTANKVYRMEVQFLQELTQFYHEALTQRVTREYAYSKDSAMHGGAAVVTTDSLEVGKKLFEWGQTISNYLFRTFYWEAERTFALRRNETSMMIYDQYLVNFLCAVIPSEYRNVYPTINQFSTTYGGREFGGRGDVNIWEVILRKDFNLLRECNKNAAIVDVNRIVQTRMYGSLRASKFSYFVATDPERYRAVKLYSSQDGEDRFTKSVEEPLVNYVFSESFYNGVPVGEFEEIVVDVIKKDVMDHKRLLAYCETYFDLSEKDRLYHGAILMLLLRVARKLRGPL